MPGPKVGLFKRVNVRGRWLYCPVVQSANGRIHPEKVLVNGQEERHPEGAFYISWREAGKLIRRSVGKQASEAEAARRRREAALNAQANGVRVAEPTSGSEAATVSTRSEPEIKPERQNPYGNGVARRQLQNTVTEYLDEIKLTKKPATYKAYKTTLDYFLVSCKKGVLEEIGRSDVLRYIVYLRDEETLSDRSVNNNFTNLMTFLKAHGISRATLGLKKEDTPKYTEQDVEIYDQADLEKFFVKCDEDELVIFKFFLNTGMREQEVMHAYWSDVIFSRGVIRMTHKPAYRWTPKANKEREIPVKSELLELLKEWKAKSDSKCSLIFPTSGCRPKLDFLDICRAVAKRAAFDPKSFWLHKFRATFCTWHLWGGVDLRTVQSWMGHSDLESTMRYLKPNQSQAVRDKVEAFGASGGK